MEQIVEGFGFKSDAIQKDDKEGIKLYSRAVRIMREAQSGIAGWVHSIAMRYNNPESPAIAAARFTAKMEELIAFITSDQAGEYQLEGRDCKLTGTSPLAAAYRKIHGAMEYGADLDEQDTSSKCAKFMKKALEEEKEAKRLAAIAEEMKAQGIDPESREGLALIKGKGLEDVEGDSKEEDQFDKWGKEFAQALREYGGFIPDQIQDVAESAIGRIHGSIAKWKEKAGKESGLIKNVA